MELEMKRWQSPKTYGSTLIRRDSMHPLSRLSSRASRLSS